MAQPVTTVTNLTLGPGYLYRGAFGAVEPADSTVNTTLAVTGFTYCGGTLDGTELEIQKTYTDLAVDQIVDDAGARVTARRLMIKCNMAEITLANLALALNETASVTAGAGFSAFEPNGDNSADVPVYSALIFDGWTGGGLRRRVIVRKALSVANVAFAYKKDGQTVYTVSWRSHYVSSSIRPFRIIDEEPA